MRNWMGILLAVDSSVQIYSTFIDSFEHERIEETSDLCWLPLPLLKISLCAHKYVTQWNNHWDKSSRESIFSSPINSFQKNIEKDLDCMKNTCSPESRPNRTCELVSQESLNWIVKWSNWETSCTSNKIVCCFYFCLSSIFIESNW